MSETPRPSRPCPAVPDMPRVSRLSNHAATALVGASGLVLAWMRYLLPAPDDPFSVVHHPLEPTALHLHVLAAPLFVLAVGTIVRDHILMRIRNPGRRQGRRSGLLAAALLVPMVASGYLLQTVTADGARRLLVVLHVGSSLVFLGAYGVHLAASLLSARRRRGARRSPADRTSAFDPADLHLRGRLEPPEAGRAAVGRSGTV